MLNSPLNKQQPTHVVCYFLNGLLAAKHQNDNNDQENKAERAAANPDGTGKNRR